MPEREEHELDVDFEVIEDPEDLVFPRLPNVVSHRGHKVKITAVIHDLPHPERTTEITVGARVHVLNNAIMGEKGHVTLPFQLWGIAEDVMATFPSDQYPRLPFKIEIIVPKVPDDDHLGEGPHYEAMVGVRTVTTQLESNAQGDSDNQTQAEMAAAAATEPRTEGSFIIRFTSQ